MAYVGVEELNNAGNKLQRTVERGFTLIELVIVLVVLGVLAAFAVPQFVGLQDDANASGAAANLGSLVTQAYSSTLATGGSLASVAVTGSTTLNLSNGGSDAATECAALDTADVFVGAGIVDSAGAGRNGDFVVDAADAGSEVSFTIPVEPSGGIPQTYVCYVGVGE